MNVLFIGNSYTNRNNLPDLLIALAASRHASEPLETERILANGASLRQHWNAGTARESIGRGGWDYVVLQEQSTLPLKNPARYHENVRLFDADIKASGGRTVLYGTWPRQSAPDGGAALNEAVQTIAQEIGALVAPVGTAWTQLLKTHPQVSLYDRDGSHPSPAGSYLAACVFYATLFRESPIGVPMPERLGLDEKVAACIQEAAWQAVSAR